MFYARWTRKGVPAATSFVDKLQPYVAEWASAAHEQNVVTEHRLHDGAAYVALKASRPLIRVLVINDNHYGLTILFEL
jgi:hypothetical protein